MKHKSNVKSSLDDEELEVNNNPSGPTEEGDPTDGLREAVTALTQRLEDDGPFNSAIATQPFTSTAPDIVPEPGPSARSPQRNQLHAGPYQDSDNAHVNETTLSTEAAARIKVLAQCVKN